MTRRVVYALFAFALASAARSDDSLSAKNRLRLSQAGDAVRFYAAKANAPGPITVGFGFHPDPRTYAFLNEQPGLGYFVFFTRRGLRQGEGGRARTAAHEVCHLLHEGPRGHLRPGEWARLAHARDDIEAAARTCASDLIRAYGYPPTPDKGPWWRILAVSPEGRVVDPTKRPDRQPCDCCKGKRHGKATR